MKEKVIEAKTTAVATGNNFMEFVLAASLVIVAVYSGYSVRQGAVHGAEAWVLAGASAIIAVRGAFELMKHFSKH